MKLDSMRAIVQDAYGPDALTLRDIDTPAIDDNGVLVRVAAASVNALDWHMTRGMPYVIRMTEGLQKPKHGVRGIDLAGRVVEVGRNVTRFKPGDDVFGGADGSFADYVATTEDRLTARPSPLTDEQAAAFNVAGLTALQGLRDKAQLERGQRILINGAGGGVGTFAVQIAKWLGAQVTAVTRTENVELVRSLGADDVVDYKTEDFTRRDERYDVFFDIGGNRSFADCRRVMTRNGTLVAVGGPAGRWLAPAGRMLKAAAVAPLVSQRIVPFIAKNDHAGLALLAELTVAGTISPVIDRRYALSETPDAIRYVGSGQARGKLIVQVQ